MTPPAPPPPLTCDLAILGGGLAGGLIALTMASARPDLTVVVIERGEQLGGDHVWSFFASDLPPGGEALLAPLIAARWEGYEVRFPRRARALSTPYRSVTSDRLDAAVRAALQAHAILTGVEVASATPTSVTLADGRTIAAGGVIDARGAARLPHLAGGWQKFLGQTLRLSAPHGLERPVVMDARVEQVDGYRFVYCLPFSPTEVFVEDTYYSDSPVLDRPALRRRIADYAAAQGWRVESVAYEETGVLPVIAGGDFAAFWRAGVEGSPGLYPPLNTQTHSSSFPRRREPISRAIRWTDRRRWVPAFAGMTSQFSESLVSSAPHPARAGTRAALVHPLTSYSLPDAVRFALHLAALDNLSGEGLVRAGHAWAANHWRRGRFYRMLSRMLFGAAAPAARWRMLERFYGLPEPLIERFYAGRSTAADKLRILAGKPPVPISAALASLAGRGRPLADLGDPR